MGPDQGLRLVGPAGPLTDFTSETDVIIGTTRPLLERTVRRLVFERAKVDVQSGRRLAGLAVEGDRIVGARVRATAGPSSRARTGRAR